MLAIYFYFYIGNLNKRFVINLLVLKYMFCALFLSVWCTAMEKNKIIRLLIFSIVV